MSHPIDDIFRKGLSGLSNKDGLDNDWEDARRLLDLDKRRKTPLFWIWCGGIVFLSLALFTLSKGSFEDNRAVNQSVSIISEEMTFSKEGKTNENNIIKEDSNVDLPISTELAESINLLRKDIIEKDRTLKSSERDEVSGTVDPNVYLSSEESDEGAAIKSDLVPDKLQQKTTNSSLVDDKREHSAFSIASVQKLNIEPFTMRFGQVEAPKDVLLLEKQGRQVEFDFGVFGALCLDDLSPNLGFFGKTTISQKFSVDFGLGIQRFSNNASNNFSGLALDNQRGVLGELTSMNEYYYYSITLPIRIHYNIGEMSVFGGLTLERPFWLKGRQEVSLLPETFDTGSPASPDPIGSLLDEPITSIQNYSLRSVGDIDKIFFRTALGISYSPTKKMRLSSSVNYHINQKRDLSPLVNDVLLSNRKGPVWQLKMRIDYIF